MVLLEGGSIRGFIFEMVIIFGIIAFILSCLIASIIQSIHNSNSSKKFTGKQYWMVILVCMSIALIISGVVCY